MKMSSRYLGCHPPVTVTVILVLAVLTNLPHIVSGKCVFPPFLWNAPGGHRNWLTEIVYKDGTTEWDRYINITVYKTDILANQIHPRQCNPNTAHCNTIQTDVFSMECVRERDGKYIVNKQEHRGIQKKMCFKFKQINANIIQVWHSDASGAGVCTDFNMVRNEWPWIAEKQAEWDYCPASGGFNFRAYIPIQNEQVCAEEWMPSHMESECILGEGITVTYPSAACSPFSDNKTTLNIICWGHWVEDEYLYIIAGEPGKSPQFSLRLDKRIDTDFTNFTDQSVYETHMYFSPVTPIRSNGLNIKNTRVQQYRLVMHRGDAGICFDESEKCVEFASKGKCGTSHSILQKEANYCKRSCGMCNFLPTFREECHFSDDIQGEWVWFENDRKERIQVSRGFIGFSRIGGFVCKGKHWDGTDYKLFSYYKNGCRPRYTCMRMLPVLDDKKIEFQLSKSSLVDQSFSLCDHFEDDPLPIGDAVRSKYPKLLIPQQRTKENTCGLSGTIDVTMTTGRDSHRHICHGTVSDWNSESCGSYSTLTVTLQGRCSVANSATLYYEEEFICDSYVELEDDYSLLITKSTRGKLTYSCWIIKTYAESMSYRPWKHAYLLDRAQCGRMTDFDHNFLKKSKLALDVNSQDLTRPCKQKPRYTGSTKVFMNNNNNDGPYAVHTLPKQRQQPNGCSTLSLTLKDILTLTVYIISLIVIA